jgi:hypothetical protein
LQRSKELKTSINTVYKRKADKVRPVDLDKSDSSTPSNNENWKQKMKKRFKIPEEPPEKYDYLLIPKFSIINRKARLIFKRLTRMRIGKELFKTKKNLLTEILYNYKTVLAWDFTHCKKVRPEIILL